MAQRRKESYEVGFGKPPRSSQFQPGQSGNPAGRPRGAKNFATAIEQELNARVIVNENGRRKRIPKREVIAKQLVNKAAAGDLKAIPLLFSETRARESDGAEAGPDQVFDTPEDQKVFDEMIARLRSSLPDTAPSAATAEEDQPEVKRQSGQGEE